MGEEGSLKIFKTCVTSFMDDPQSNHWSSSFQALEEQVSKLRSEEGVLRRDNADIAATLQDEQKKVVDFIRFRKSRPFY